MLRPRASSDDGSRRGLRRLVDQIVVHEYGPHLANNRINPPWDALSWGPKRWSSYANICLRAQQGTAFPSLTGATYGFKAAEAFAEAFRVTNELRVASSTTWPIVDSSFYPNAIAPELIRLDAVQPWAGISTATTSRFTSYGGRVQGFMSRGPMDGTMTVSLTTRSGAKLRAPTRPQVNRWRHRQGEHGPGTCHFHCDAVRSALARCPDPPKQQPDRHVLSGRDAVDASKRAPTSRREGPSAGRRDREVPAYRRSSGSRSDARGRNRTSAHVRW